MTARHRLVSTWIAIAAILLNALMPTLSLAVEPSRHPGQQGGAQWVEICTTQGSSWVQLGPDGQILTQALRPTDDAPATAHNGHCLYCLTHAASFGLPPAPAIVLPIWPAVTHLLPHAALQNHTRLIWLIPAARAPPRTAGVLFASTLYG